jgi:regulation of enolase protein 1 (concanavalin A-like superfamily)
MTMVDLPWTSGDWLNPPAHVETDGPDLLVTSIEASDFWRTTSYGFVHDDGHALLIDFPDDSAVEVTFLLDYSGAFDQAGILVHSNDRAWIKAGVEFSDGAPLVGAVVTREVSDWSTAPVPEWSGQEVTVRVSRSGDALTVRARADGPWRLVRLAPLDPGLPWQVGPFCCAPTRSGFTARFTRFAIGPADTSLHDDDVSAG